MENSMEDLSKYSGEEYYRRPPKLNLELMKLDGNLGKFVKPEKIEGKNHNTEIGTELKVIILRVRRILGNWNDGLGTTEHNHPNDEVTLFENGRQIDKGKAKDLRQKYPTLKTTQVLYVLHEGELKKVVVSGASLGSESKAADVASFYDYLADFNSKEHLYEFYTIMKPVQEENPKNHKKYYASTFIRGDKLSPEELQNKVAPELKRLHEFFSTVEAYYRKGQPTATAKDEAEEDKPLAESAPADDEPQAINLEEEPVQEHPEEEIPF